MKQSTLIASLLATVLILAVALVFALRPRGYSPVEAASPEEIAHAQENAQKARCMSRLKIMTLAAERFTRDNGENYPDLSSPSVIRATLEKYVNDESIFSCPTTKKPFQGNVALSGKSLSAISDEAHTILFYEADNSHMDGCNVAYANGSVRWLSNEDWLAEKQKSGIP